MSKIKLNEAIIQQTKKPKKLWKIPDDLQIAKHWKWNGNNNNFIRKGDGLSVFCEIFQKILYFLKQWYIQVSGKRVEYLLADPRIRVLGRPWRSPPHLNKYHITPSFSHQRPTEWPEYSWIKLTSVLENILNDNIGSKNDKLNSTTAWCSGQTFLWHLPPTS